MVENHAGNDLLDTTDCLEAVGVFKGWKNFLFLIVLLCLLLLQVSFFLVDRGYIKIGDQVYGGEPVVEPPSPQPDQGPLETVSEANIPIDPLVDKGQPAKGEITAEMLIELVERAEATEAVEPKETAEPNEAAELDEPAEPNEAADSNEPAEPNESADPNELAGSSPVIRGIGPRIRAAVPQLQRAGQLIPREFFSKLTFEQLAWLIRFVNAVLMLTATLYCLTLLFSLKVSLNGRLGGISHISRAFFLSLLMLVLLLPWQKMLGGVVAGAMYTPQELVKWYSAKSDDMLGMVLYYLRFSGYGVLILLLLILSQLRSLRWAKAILRRLEII